MAIRFATAFGRINALSETLLKRLNEAGARPEDGILLVAHGSPQSMNKVTADKHAWYIGNHGYAKVAYTFVRFNEPSIPQGIQKLKKMGAERIVVLPMFIYPGKSVNEVIPDLIEKSAPTLPVIYAKPLGRDVLLLDDLDRKIPEDW